MSLSDSLDVRHITDGEVPEWIRALNTGFLRPSPEGDAECRGAFIQPGRTLGAFDGSRCVATFRSSAKAMTVPGGATIPCCGITNVTVTASHRRRGLLSRMMATHLAEAVEWGEPLAILIAAEYPIYGRYGFGPATWATEFVIDVFRAGLDRNEPVRDGRVDLVDPAEYRKLAPEAYDRFRVTQPGALARDDDWWKRATGEMRFPANRDPRTPFFALYRNGAGRVDGLLSYRTDDHWDEPQPKIRLEVVDLVTTTTPAASALWRFLVTMDWVGTVRAGRRAPDDVMPLLLGDPRAARSDFHSDFMWLRVLDVPAALSVRSYATTGQLVLDVRDPAGHAAGRFLVDGSPDGALCTRTTRSADLTLDVGTLSTLYLGDESATRLAALGAVHEETSGALSRADLMFRTPRRPWCNDTF